MSLTKAAALVVLTVGFGALAGAATTGADLAVSVTVKRSCTFSAATPGSPAPVQLRCTAGAAPAVVIPNTATATRDAGISVVTVQF